ncbi:MAG TPA: GlsB/YeaQ/YmgE family stress response membrane protein [Acidimicrobiia bacterium]|nr:GlsB/YeaQ/YmgE family stress response membrane protein [Acidimicrobiia bacterium]
MGLVVWLVIGLIAGFLARAIVPGRESMGVLGTIVLGLIGSLVGGFLGNLFVEGNLDIEAAGIVGSVIGAIVALLVYRSMGSRVST